MKRIKMILNNKITIIFAILIFPLVHSAQVETEWDAKPPEIFAFGRDGDQALLSAKEDETITLVYRDGLKLICQARATGALYWKWVVNGEGTMGQYNIWNDNIDRENQTTRIELPLSNNLEDKYTCVARSRLGVDQRSFTVIMTPLPSDGGIIERVMEEIKWLGEMVVMAAPNLLQIPILLLALALMYIFWKKRMEAEKPQSRKLLKKLKSEEVDGGKVEPVDPFFSKIAPSEGIRHRLLTPASSFELEIPGNFGTPITHLKLKKQNSELQSEAKL